MQKAECSQPQSSVTTRTDEILFIFLVFKLSVQHVRSHWELMRIEMCSLSFQVLIIKLRVQPEHDRCNKQMRCYFLSGLAESRQVNNFIDPVLNNYYVHTERHKCDKTTFLQQFQLRLLNIKLSEHDELDNICDPKWFNRLRDSRRRFNHFGSQIFKA